ncbi:hypothetical protein [uncultured Reyranella sp.]|uniref:hypothetical protein n=1 Tax=uncultured Reyranella sp. TaxID=735512 RepID=UPI00259D0EC3|nr:hypothetical protein [uncultured Reyranella sp.]
MTRTAPAWQLLLAFALSLLVLCGLIGWLQNVHIISANGMYKSIQAEPWIASPSTARLDPSNYLFFPLYGVSARLLDALGILRGVAWKQFAYLNAFWASIGTAVVYAFVHRLTGSARVAAFTSVFHLGCGFVLLLSVISEDIMPGYVLVLASMALAGLWFDRPNWRRVAIVGAVFTLGWLIEWRLLFPTLPAFVLALLIAPGRPKERAGQVVVLLVSILAVSGIVQLLWEGHNGAIGLHDILWTGKGVATGWAGITWDKAWMMLSGVGNYFLLVGGYVDPGSAKAAMGLLAISVLLEVAIFIAAILLLWPRRGEPRLRAVAIVFLGTLGAGQVLNFYSQPQDPQMQINVMPWLVVAWALLLASLLPTRRGLTIVLAVLSFAPFAWNVSALAKWRGDDTRWLAATAALEKRFPPDSTVFLYFGYEPVTTWKYALWSRTWDWDNRVDVPPAPAADPKFKWIAVNAGAIRHPDWTAAEHAAAIKRDIDLALDRGYRVVVSDMWSWPPDVLAAYLGTVAASGRTDAIYRMLHDDFRATEAFHDPIAGTYFELQRR